MTMLVAPLLGAAAAHHQDHHHRGRLHQAVLLIVLVSAVAWLCSVPPPLPPPPPPPGDDAPLPRVPAAPPLRFKPGGAPLKIVQVTDQHVGHALFALAEDAALEGVARLLADEAAAAAGGGGIDLVVHTGDVVHGDGALDDKASRDWAALALLPLRRYAVAGTPGNHDGQNLGCAAADPACGKRAVLQSFGRLPSPLTPPLAPWNLTHAYVLPVLPSDGGGDGQDGGQGGGGIDTTRRPHPRPPPRPAFNLIFLDTGGGLLPGQVGEDALRWLEQQQQQQAADAAAAAAGGSISSSTPPPPAVLFRHIPSPAMVAAQRDRALRCVVTNTSISREPPNVAPAVAGGGGGGDTAGPRRYARALRGLNVVLSVSGHDHADDDCCWEPTPDADDDDNDAGGGGDSRSSGIWECFGRQSGMAGYYLSADGRTLRDHLGPWWLRPWRWWPWSLGEIAREAAPRGVRVFLIFEDGRVASYTRLLLPAGDGDSGGGGVTTAAGPAALLARAGGAPITDPAEALREGAKLLLVPPRKEQGLLRDAL